MELREQYLKDLNRLGCKHPIIYLDESGFKSHEHRPQGYSKQGTPCYGTYNWQLKNQTNAIGAIHEGKLFAVGLFDSKVNSDIFHFWVDQFLLPELPSNSVIVMDNAAFHKRQDIQDLLAQHGHQILWLPPYSPDLNPIEKMWAWVKAKRKKWLVNSIDKLFSRFFNECMGN
ncbi:MULTISPECIES: IS630 family transposase [Acinetobacter calcoaceticus/baumannii complex]|uniref:IS630 family transposase n=1 Tax=Acinetobacter baumannii TaxID=470 RepID=A0AAW9P665_ACIBA|nr:MULTISPECIES: IS630 family transposase [Acinetobacter calcoaceticus/baumannii complex]KRI43187.1 transposase [Acinetobacter baumannii]KRJ14272.1 transposase [Acinetobacter nosocomialis]MBD0456169.1 IS630 family transposase [Acinetobacter baumannii]MDV4341547.1 IS630 family transposase [Acinetobacter baumannii]MEC5496707.1 IS630 family transposase [Acinetobacter baumannii]